MIINAVFSGGGIKGLAYIGALRFLEGRGYKIFNAGGSSVGALFASLIIAGYSSKELVELVDNFDINLLMNENNKLQSIFKIKEWFNKKGLFSIKSFELFVEELLMKKNIRYFKDVKFGDDYLLKIIVTEVSTPMLVVIPDDLPKFNINRDTFPIAKAVVMSCNIPFFYYPYTINGYTFVDGGVSDNYPIWLFDKSYYKTLGFKLSSVEKEKKQWFYPMIKIGEAIKNKVFVIKEKTDEQAKTIFIEIDDLKMIDFKKGLKQKKNLYLIGYNSTKEFFYKNNIPIF